MCNNFFSHFSHYSFQYIGLLFLSLCIQCDFDPDDEYYADIEPSLPIAQITLNDTDSLISMWKTTNCIYNFSSTPDLEISIVNVFIDDELVVSSPSSHVEFTIEPNQYTAGNHIIRIATTTNSGTGSLADRVGAEGFYFEREWVLEIEHIIPGNLYLFINEMILENGLLKVSWDKYSSRDFQKYELFGTPTFSEFESEGFASLISVFDSTRNYFYDNTYVGGLRAYHIMLRAGDTFFGGTMDMIDTVNFPFPGVLKAQPQGNDLLITFSKCLFPAVFKEYRVFIRPDEYNAPIEIAVIQNINDTTLLIPDLPFGSSFTVKIATYPDGIDYDVNRNYEPTSKYQAHLGDPSFAFEQGRSLFAGQSLYFGKNYDGNIYRYSTTNNSVSKIIDNDLDTYGQGRIHISFDGKYLIYSDVINNISRLFTLPEMTEIAYRELINSGSIRISNNGLLPVHTKHEMMVFDCLNNTYIDTLYTNFTGIYPSGTYYGSESCISPNGDFLYVRSMNGDTLYHQSVNNDYLAVFSFPLSEKFLEFNPINNDELIYYNQHSLTIFNYKTLSVSKNYTHIQAPFSHVDPITGSFLALDNLEERRFGIYNISDGSKVGSIRIANNVSVENLILYNNVIYSSYGYKMEITP